MVYKILVTKWKCGIGPDDRIIFNEELQNISASIIELTNIDESSHEYTIVMFITKIDSKKL